VCETRQVVERFDQDAQRRREAKVRHAANPRNNELTFQPVTAMITTPP
jgi:hypothetical protein